MSSADLIGLSHSALLQLFTVDLTAKVPSCPVLRFCNFSDSNGASIAFQGLTYAAYPIEATGFEKSINGTLPTPELSVSNIFSDISSLILTYSGMLDAKVTRIKVLAKNLDGEPGANSAEIESTDIYYISRYSENSLFVKFTLRHPLDMGKLFLPKRRLASLTGD
ncbi:MAG: phage minor tail protein L [Oscillatoriophycideae cyanobacterium NC_groundwater_1537_Pr4_S-0.65um_50_18]|nr:phage minor tail protein L [Candidatus Woesearchaeota archaeon]MBI4783998.1 phage minor tail protein L [Oscillatoriophycideae cyanobacterium NC_groundwater_1537_Pr4_S-0.65um_50_18]